MSYIHIWKPYVHTLFIWTPYLPNIITLIFYLLTLTILTLGLLSTIIPTPYLVSLFAWTPYITTIIILTSYFLHTGWGHLRFHPGLENLILTMLSSTGCHVRAKYIGCIGTHAHCRQVTSLLCLSDVIMWNCIQGLLGASFQIKNSGEQE